MTPNPPKAPKSKHSAFDLPEDRLATTTTTGERVYLYPAFVQGTFRHIRSVVYWVLIVIFLGLPWIKINGHQWVLLDIVNRRFSIFGLQFWGHDAPLLFLVFVSFILFFGLITSLFGRIWCGWACPQTVFIDRIFRKIEELIEGASVARKRLDEGPWSVIKVFKKTVKWALFLACSLLITHSFLAYFVGSTTVLTMMQSSPTEHFASFMTIVITTAIILFDFGWFREQFCIIACPYGRLQSVIMDENSLVVGYDKTRGDAGDCIDCYRCVQVCPTGVDIRRGVQLECIMCTACIDACNAVMPKIGKPKGLIRYDSGNGLKQLKTQWLRPRVLIYLVLLCIALSTLGYLVTHRNRSPIHLTRSQAAAYTLTQSGDFLNTFTARVHNEFFEAIDVSFAVAGPSDARIILPLAKVRVAAGESLVTPIVLTYPVALLHDGQVKVKIDYTIWHNGSQHSYQKDITLLGPL